MWRLTGLLFIEKGVKRGFDQACLAWKDLIKNFLKLTILGLLSETNPSKSVSLSDTSCYMFGTGSCSTCLLAPLKCLTSFRNEIF